MARPLIDFVHTADLPVQAFVFPWWGRLEGRLLSRDDDSGAESWLVALPAGWQSDGGTLDRDEELLVVDGGVEEGGDALRAFSYRFRPANADRGAARSTGGARLLVGLGERSVEPADPVREIRRQVDEMDWQPLWTEGLPGGVARKTLRSEPERDEAAWMLGVLPGWTFRAIESHDFDEEHFILAGSFETNIGLMTEGSYLYHPPVVDHGPTRSKTGCLTYVRGRGAFNLRVTPREDFVFPSDRPSDV
ncbi:MAG: DUF4437 domain-containing protein [Dehalococcoidia bacterium]